MLHRAPFFASKPLTTIAALGCAVGFAACSGGGGGGASPAAPSAIPPSTPVTTSSSSGMASVSFTIPLTALQSTQRSSQYVSTATNSLTITPAGGTASVFSLTNSQNCYVTPAGKLCTLQVPLPIGNISFTARLFASSDGSGTPLSIGSGSATITANTANPTNLTLDAVINSMKVSLSQSSFPAATPATTTVSVALLDAADKQVPFGSAKIVDQNDSPITVSLGSTAPASTSVSPATLGTAAETFTYNGVGIPSGMSVTAVAQNASATTVASAATTVAFTAPINQPITASTAALSFLMTGSSAAQTFTVAQPNGSGNFSAATSGGDATVASASISGNTVTVIPNHAGATNVVVTGDGAQTVTIPIGVTTTALTLQ